MICSIKGNKIDIKTAAIRKPVNIMTLRVILLIVKKQIIFLYEFDSGWFHAYKCIYMV